MRGRTMKISRILLYYSLAATALLVLAFVVFVKTISVPQTHVPRYLILVNDKNILSALQDGNLDMPFNDLYSSVVTNVSLENYYISAMLKNIPLIVICLIAMIAAGTLILSKLLRRQNEIQSLLLAKQLSRIDEEETLTEQHPSIVKAYQEIKVRLDSYALDYVRLSAYVTHEQKNILSLLRAKLQLSDNAALTAEVDKVTDSLDDILTLSASNPLEQSEMVDTALLCANVCDDYKKVYPQIYFDFDDETNHWIHAKELWICRAVSNLVGNAVKYGGNGKILVSVTNQKGSVIIAVSDEGEGIDEQEQEKLFDYQYRVGKLRKNGYGIGLSLVRHVCMLCGGICWAENRDVRGTTFYMIFPEALTLD